MRIAVAVANLLLGSVYTSYGLLTIVDMKRGWRTSGFSHFGAAWIGMAFTCGPHHLDHGLHSLISGRPGDGLDLLSVLVGVPFGVTWFVLRVEALFGGRGDRFVSGTPAWLEALPTVAAVYLVANLGAAISLGDGIAVMGWRIVPNLMLVGLYLAIGYVLLRTQLRNHPVLGGWSLSGVALVGVFYTCALEHAVFAFFVSTGRYDLDIHGQLIATIGVPAAAYFLWVVAALHRGGLRDWNTGARRGADEARAASRRMDELARRSV